MEDEKNSLKRHRSSDDVLFQQEHKSRKLDRFTVDIKRGHSIARYEIKICYDKGNWSSMKDDSEVKLAIFKYVRLAGNSLGGLVDVDFSAVDFGKHSHLTVLNQFYGTLEDLFHQWEISERPAREATVEKRLILDVPTFKHWKSDNTNVIDSGEETNPQLSDQMCQHLLETDEGKYKSRCQRFALLQHNFDFTAIQYNTVMNSGSEATNLEFKLLKNDKGLTKRILKDSNKLLLYVSAFGIREGGLILYGVEDGTGQTKGQILSGTAGERHSFENIKYEVLSFVRKHTVCLNRQRQRCNPTDLLEIKCIPVVNIPPKNRTTLENDYYAVIIIHIQPFDGIIFTSSRGPEAYRITKRSDIVRLGAEEWLTEKCRKITAETVTNGLRKMNFEFTSAVDDTNVFELPNSIRRIREKMFRISGLFPLYPEGLLHGRHGSVLLQIQQRFQATSDEGILLAELCSEAIYLFIISRRYGMHFCMLPVQRNQDMDVLMDTLSTEAIELKRHLWEIGGCKLNLVIQTHLVLEDVMNTQQFNSKLHEIHHLQDSEINTVLDCYIRVIGSFPNSTLQHHFGVEVLNVLTENQFRVLASMDSCRKLWVHGLPGSGKTVLAVMMIKHLVKRRESPVLFVAENQGIVSKLASQFGPKFGTEVECISRIKFLETDIVYFSRVRSIVMDEVHHFRIDDESKNWYEKADKIVSGKCREGQWSNGYLWLFMDMFQKENKFKSGIPDLKLQEPKKELTEVIRCSRSIWAVVKGKLDTDTILADDNCEYYKYLLSKSSCLHTVQGQEVEICTSEDRPDNSYGLYFQVAYEVNTLLEQHWRPEDIGILFSVRRLAEPFAKQYNSLNSSSGIQLVSCKYDAPNRIVCDSVRRFSGLEKPCIILVEPAVNEYYFSANKFQALGMSRAMIKLIVIEKKANSSHLRRHNSQN